MVREKIELKWAPDSLFNNSLEDTISVKTDSSALLLTEIEKQVVEAKQKEEIAKSENNPVTEEKEKTTEEIKEIVAFTEPQAITLEQAYKLYTKGVKFVDARDEADFIAGHITNSINIPFDDLDNHKQKFELLSKEKPMVIYCAGTECDLSILLGNLLFEQGYKQVYVFFGGWNEWLEANYPTEKSSE
ncbi:MAG: rhodanese-like domain-containing protein [bacterium]|nr:rhodanese-like domain-containing protein [bacterium]